MQCTVAYLALGSYGTCSVKPWQFPPNAHGCHKQSPDRPARSGANQVNGMVQRHHHGHRKKIRQCSRMATESKASVYTRCCTGAVYVQRLWSNMCDMFKAQTWHAAGRRRQPTASILSSAASHLSRSRISVACVARAHTCEEPIEHACQAA